MFPSSQVEGRNKQPSQAPETENLRNFLVDNSRVVVKHSVAELRLKDCWLQLFFQIGLITQSWLFLRDNMSGNKENGT